MATKTTNYNLVKPSLTDAADITAMNGNWDAIDAQLKNLHNIMPNIIFSESEPTPQVGAIWLKPIE